MYTLYTLLRSSLRFLLLCSAMTILCLACRAGTSPYANHMELAARTTILLNNSMATLPLLNLEKKTIANVNIGGVYADHFHAMLNNYTHVQAFTYTPFGQAQLKRSLERYTTIIIQTNESSLSDPNVRQFLYELNRDARLLLVYYGKPSGLKPLGSLKSPVICSPETTQAAAIHAAQLIFGGTEAKGVLPHDVLPAFKKGDGYQTRAIRLGYSEPEEAGMSRQDIEEPIDEIMASAIAQKATPGGVVLIVKDGKVVFNKSYGAFSYGSEQLTKTTSIFDLASVTKIAATTLAAMRLYEQEKLNLNSTMGDYLPEAMASNKKNINVQQLMLHEAGLVPYIPFHNALKAGDYSFDSTVFFPVKIADGYFIRQNYYRDIMLPRMLNTGLRPKGRYEYSDLSMFFLKEIIEKQAGETLDNYVAEQFYQPLGMQTAGFNPRRRFAKDRLVPTENDTYFRRTLLQGYVHDQGAALAGGVAGHAGLFASANDLAILFQMFLNGGSYGGVQYFKQSTIDLFTSAQSPVSRRGLGFDRWDPQPGRNYPSELASPQTYGHTGFTGTAVWVDPKFNLIYIFLSNRLNGQPANRLSSLRIRPRIQDAVYRAILKGNT